jgi:hypothetical protein
MNLLALADYGVVEIVVLGNVLTRVRQYDHVVLLIALSHVLIYVLLLTPRRSVLSLSLSLAGPQVVHHQSLLLRQRQKH